MWKVTLSNSSASAATFGSRSKAWTCSACGGDAAQAAALEGPDLDRQLRPQLGQEAVEREALALLHLPAIGGHAGSAKNGCMRASLCAADGVRLAVRERRGAQVRRPLAPVPGR